MTPQELKPRIIQAAAKYGLKPELVYAIVKKESSFNQFAARYEPAYRWILNPNTLKPSGCSLATEEMFQKTSLGLMQCMGGVLREHGYTGWLTAILADVEAQLDLGCKHLAQKIAKYGELMGISAYNAGSPSNANVGYVDDVLAYAQAWRSIPDPVMQVVVPATPEPSIAGMTEADHLAAHKRIDEFLSKYNQQMYDH
jgi:soluble lytic murein transglycosylase-like protein